MNTNVCPSCGAAQPDGILCHDDSAALVAMLAAVPQLIDQLDVAVSKQAKVVSGGKAGKGSAHEKSPINFGVMAVRDALLVELMTAVADVTAGTWKPQEDRLVAFRAATQPYIGPFHSQCDHASCERMRVVWVEKAPPLIAQVVGVLGENVNALRRHPDVGRAVSRIGRAIKDSYRAIDQLQERQYLGQCLFEEDGLTCHAEVWARPGAHQVTCTQCGITHEVGERRAWLLRQAEDLLVTVREASRYVGEIGHITVTEASIRGYLHRKRIVYRPGGTKIRLGDLLSVVLDESERKSA